MSCSGVTCKKLAVKYEHDTCDGAKCYLSFSLKPDKLVRLLRAS